MQGRGRGGFDGVPTKTSLNRHGPARDLGDLAGREATHTVLRGDVRSWGTGWMPRGRAFTLTGLPATWLPLIGPSPSLQAAGAQGPAGVPCCRPRRGRAPIPPNIQVR